MSKSPAYHLTRRAALDLRDIYDRSRREWGEAVANRYMIDLYAAMSKASTNPDAGLLRKNRAAPFLMISARQHFIIYDRIPDGIAILTLLHQVRDIDSLVAGLSPFFLQEVEKLKAAKPARARKRSVKKKGE
jgi:toxin ParE1/3/4